MSVKNASRPVGLSILCAALLFIAACSTPSQNVQSLSSVELDPQRQQLALMEVQQLQSKGSRVWCVPFARNVSGVDIRGNANTWWGKATGIYDKGKQPLVGAVMAFRKTSKLPMGHVAVVSEVVSDREIRVDHANWKRNKVSLKMDVIDVSENNDWSAVRLKSQPTAFGSVYPITGFIYPE
ncbi:CHAP domain-containing protein [Sulfitobacter sp. MF3-043]|uniref:CHAP domain-containing protein n=1 Tax=Sulfitobacter sediminivivens TaxID=3252902 RepID=UPI0036DC287D